VSQGSNPFSIFLWIGMLIAIGFAGGWQCRETRHSKDRTVDPNTDDWLARFSETELRYAFQSQPPFDTILIFDTANGHMWLREPNRITDLGTPTKPRRIVSALQAPPQPSKPNPFRNRLEELQRSLPVEEPRP